MPVLLTLLLTGFLSSEFLSDAAWISSGAAVDLGATQYSLDHCPTCHEANPAGQSFKRRLALKGALVAGGTAGLHELRKRGHPTWAKWIARGICAVQVGAGLNALMRSG